MGNIRNDDDDINDFKGTSRLAAGLKFSGKLRTRLQSMISVIFDSGGIL